MNDNQNFNVVLGRRLMTLRQNKNMSQEVLGSYLGVRGQQIHKYETGENKITPERLNICARVLDVPVGYFYGETEQKQNITDVDRVTLIVANEIVNLPPDIRKGVYTLIKIINQSYRTKEDAA